MRLFPMILGAALLVLVSGCGGSAPAASTNPPASTTASSCILTVNITQAGGTVWGTVTVVDGSVNTTVTSASQQVSVPCNSTATLSEAAVSSATWPFTNWTLNGDSGAYSSTTKSGTTISVPVKAATSVTATYILSAGGSSGSSSGSGGSSYSSQSSGSSSGASAAPPSSSSSGSSSSGSGSSSGSSGGSSSSGW